MDVPRKLIALLKERVCEQLAIDDFHNVEIEAKKRVRASQAKDLRKHLLRMKNVDHVKTTFFLDQFLDTPQMDLFRLGVSLRLRYKRNGSRVYLQYKGPGFKENGLLYRSEFSSKLLKTIIREESHHDVIRFSKTSIQQILSHQIERDMARAMTRHLGAAVVKRIAVGPIICVYQKDKFVVDLGSAFLEPSLDRVFAFHIERGLHPLSMFWEYENEIKSTARSLDAKMLHVPELLAFDEKLAREFDLKPEPLDKYHRCTSLFQPRGSARA